MARVVITATVSLLYKELYWQGAMLATLQLHSTVEVQSASPGEYHHLGLLVQIPVPLEGVWLKVPALQTITDIYRQYTIHYTHTNTAHTKAVS